MNRKYWGSQHNDPQHGELTNIIETNERTERFDSCPRTLALYKPGVRIEGVRCSYSYAGSVPLTGRQRCHLCGLDKPQAVRS